MGWAGRRNVLHQRKNQMRGSSMKILRGMLQLHDTHNERVLGLLRRIRLHQRTSPLDVQPRRNIRELLLHDSVHVRQFLNH